MCDIAELRFVSDRRDNCPRITKKVIITHYSTDQSYYFPFQHRHPRLGKISKVGVTELLSLNRGDITGILNEVQTHGVAGVMGCVTLEAGQAEFRVEHCIDHPGIKTTIAVGVGISKLIDFILYFQDNAQSSAQKNFPLHRLIV